MMPADLTPAAAALLALARAGHLVLLDPWLERAATTTALASEGTAPAPAQQPADAEALHVLLDAGLLRIERSSGAVFVCVPHDAPHDPSVRLTALTGLPRRYHHAANPAALHKSQQ